VHGQEGSWSLAGATAVIRRSACFDTAFHARMPECCHIGSGVSVTAIRDGHSVDTSMGFTPLEGARRTTGR
jgi:acetate kinase